MAKDLVLVESPSKAKTINKYLGRKYVVEATVGHLRNLPKTKLGIDIEDEFKPRLLNIRGKGDLIKKIKSLASKAENIYIATDPDREGEAIAQDIVEIIGEKTKAEFHRILFHEITKKSVKAAMEAPISINTDLVTSQRARRAMDRIIGYKISPLLWLALLEDTGSSLSAGRVQSVALRIICEREAEIDKFVKTEYWSIIADFKNDKGEILSSKLVQIDNKPIKILPKPVLTDEELSEFNKENIALNDEASVLEIFNRINEKNTFVISDITKKSQKRNPAPPFITSSLQAEASKKLGVRPRQTMRLAQNLYEGINLGKEEGVTGLITYMRTDSTRVNAEIVDEARKLIGEKFGLKYVPESPRSYEKKKKQKIQDAHEAIRPTSLKYTPEFVKEYLDPQQFKLYELIWNRFIASQMESVQLEITSVSIKADEFLFRASGTSIKFNGFLSIYNDDSDENESNNNSEDSIIPLGLEKNDPLDLDNIERNQHFTKPPPRFSESTLIKEMEKKGIGRPSTYALIMSTLQDRGYVIQVDRKLSPTKLGKKVNDVLVKNFPEILNVNFTAKMEEELDGIASGEIEYLSVLNDFYIPFANIKSLKEISSENNEPEYTGDICPDCGGRTVIRKGKFGKFIGCEKYPDCNFTKILSTGITCPKCNEGEVISRRSKRGRIFYGCNKYPDCDYMSWKLPSADEDPEN